MCGCGCAKCDQEDLGKKELLETVYDAYDKNGGNENVLKEISVLLKQFPQFADKTDELLHVAKEHYCKGFLKGFKENF